MITASSSPGILTTGLIGDVGLILDITAAFFLAMSFVLKKQAEMFRETSDYWNGNPFRLPKCSQTIARGPSWVHVPGARLPGPVHSVFKLVQQRV